MNRFTALVIAVLPFAYCFLHTEAEVNAAPAREVSVSEIMDNFSSMLDSVPPPPNVSEAEVVEMEENDSQTYIFVNIMKAYPPKPVNLGGDGRLTLIRPASGERVTAAYRKKNGSYDPAGLKKIDRIMRCRLTGKETHVSVKLIEILDAIEDHFGKKGIVILSGYRTPTFNSLLPEAARRSLHMLGWAADIRVPGYSPGKVSRFARKLRAGGVGHYPYSAFTHLDSGRTRYWTVRR